MTAISSGYAKILGENKILYMPSCLIVEMLTKLYSQVTLINLSGDLHHITPDLVVLLRRMSDNIGVTAMAYKEKRIRFFIGDWREDKLRARKLFFNIMARLGYITELLGDFERRVLHASIEEMTAAWAALDRIMEGKAEACTKKGKRDEKDENAEENSDCADCADCDPCKYFRSSHPGCWRQVMANIVLSLDANAEYESSDTYLILLCYKRIKTALMRVIEDIERKTRTPRKFSADRILYISNEDIPISCPKCALMTETLRRGDSGVIVRDYEKGGTATRPRSTPRPIRPRGKAEIRGRYPMPPTLAGIFN